MRILALIAVLMLAACTTTVPSDYEPPKTTPVYN
ncbi:exported protein of unknown function [Pseudorhizobium banfieldiae]|uniref:Lipoprotein n=1 Tax=Pseudorhizobium banfieldiae TaxID=1125847 RepID=L0NFS3_9HYPH|nr:exported protein of unknown function [Pseudorhizobium banfieldiae]